MTEPDMTPEQSAAAWETCELSCTRGFRPDVRRFPTRDGISLLSARRTAVISGASILVLSYHLKPVSMVLGSVSPAMAFTAASTHL